MELQKKKEAYDESIQIEKAYFHQELEVQESEIQDIKIELKSVKDKVVSVSTSNSEILTEVTVKEGLKELNDQLAVLKIDVPKQIATNEVLLR